MPSSVRLTDTVLPLSFQVSMGLTGAGFSMRVRRSTRALNTYRAGSPSKRANQAFKRGSNCADKSCAVASDCHAPASLELSATTTRWV